MNHEKAWGPRVCLERMMIIFARIRAGEFPNCSILAADLECSTKTVFRDIQFLQERFQLPIVYVKERNGYTIDPKHRLPWFVVDALSENPPPRVLQPARRGCYPRRAA